MPRLKPKSSENMQFERSVAQLVLTHEACAWLPERLPWLLPGIPASCVPLIQICLVHDLC